MRSLWQPQQLFSQLLPCLNAQPVFPYPILLLRGLGRSSAFWLHFTDILRQSADVLLVDLLATGKSKCWHGRLSIHEYAKDVLHTIKCLKIEEVHILGMSLGGMVALEIAHLVLTHKKNASLTIKGLTILGSSSRGFGEKRIQKQALKHLLLSLFSSIPKHKYFAHYLVPEEYLRFHPEIIDTWDNIYKKEGFSHIGGICQLIAALFYKLKAFCAHDFPVTFVATKQDKLVPWKNSVSLWQNIPGAQLIILNSGGHDLTTSIEKKEDLEWIIPTKEMG